MSAKADNSCSLCGSNNFRGCKCPWHLPFDRWPAALLRHLKAGTPPSDEASSK